MDLFNKQLMFFIFFAAANGVGSMIDTGFGNRIDVDSVCVLSVYTIIASATTPIFAVGKYAFRTTMKDAKVCLGISVVIGAVLGVIIWSLSDLMPYLFTLTQSQNALLSKCLRIYAISLPVLAASDFSKHYASLRCKNKIVTVATVVFYILMISIDAAVLRLTDALVWMLWGTFISNAVLAAIVVFGSGVLREPCSYNFRETIRLVRYGLDTVVGHSIDDVGTIITTSFASMLGTELLGIHAICSGIVSLTRRFTGALFTFTLTEMDGENDSVKKFKKCSRILLRHGWLIIVIAYTAGYSLLLFTHGVVPLGKCAPYVALYVMEVFPLLFYDSFSVFISTEKQTQYLRYGGVISLLTKVPFVIIGFYCGWGIFTFAFIRVFNYTMRAIYMYVCCKKVLKGAADTEIK